MTDSPAAAGRTTRSLRRVGATAAAICGAFISSIVAMEVSAALHGGAPGAHFSLYAGAMLFAVLAASCLSLAFARRLMARSDEKVEKLGEKLDRNGDKIDDLITVQRRRDYETGLMAAELADLVTTNRQLVAEAARWRAADRDAEAERKADMEHLVSAVLPDLLAQVRREGLRDGAREGEMRGFARGLAAAREMADGDTGPIINN